jgi:H+/Na+-translocating ferredoxin:NAD+ oxidoreductase subunit G
MTLHQAPKNALLLALFALVATGLLAIIQQLTAERVAENERQMLIKKLNSVIAADQYDNDIFNDRIYRADALLGTQAPQPIFRARKGSNPVALIVSIVAPNGYNGAISLLAGIDQQGVVQGVRVIQHKETPGLGDGIEYAKSNWITQFDQRALSTHHKSTWKVKKDGGDFDALTGATITSRAMVEAVFKGLQFAHQQGRRLYTSTTEWETP